MYDKLIEVYVNKLSLNDIFYFANKENFVISNHDAEVVLFYIKNYWRIIYKEDPTKIFNEFKTKVSKDTYNKALELYNTYKNKINF